MNGTSHRKREGKVCDKPVSYGASQTISIQQEHAVTGDGCSQSRRDRLQPAQENTQSVGA